MEESINEILDQIIREGVPRSVSEKIEESRKILEGSGSLREKNSEIISILDEISEDVDLSPTARAEVWNAISSLSALEREKKI